MFFNDRTSLPIFIIKPPPRPPPPLQKKKNGSNNLFSSQSDRHFVAQSNIRPFSGALIPYPDFPLNEEQ